MELRFKIIKEGNIIVSEMNDILNIYENFISLKYGANIEDSFMEILKKAFPEYKDSKKYLSQKRKLAITLVEENLNNDKEELLKCYDEFDNIVAVARLKKANKKEGIIFDLAFVNEKVKKEIFAKVILYVIDYFSSLNYKKIYLEIPFKDVIARKRANDLGFLEDPEDILENNFTYVLNKVIER